MDQQKKTVEGFLQPKKYVQTTILLGYQVPVSDVHTLDHYYAIQDSLDNLINREMGWRLEN